MDGAWKPETRPEARRAELLSHLVYWKNEWIRLGKKRDEMVAAGEGRNVDYGAPLRARARIAAIQTDILAIDRSWGWNTDASSL